MYLTPLKDIPKEVGFFLIKNQEEDSCEGMVEVILNNKEFAYIMQLFSSTCIEVLTQENEKLKNYTWYGPIVLLNKE